MRYVVFLLAGCLLGQPKPAPPEVDAALRERAGKFFQAHVDGKFRQADAYVAEDAKDAFFEQDKPRYRKIEGMTIDYNDEFTKAVVNTKVEMERKAARMGGMLVQPTITYYS